MLFLIREWYIKNYLKVGTMGWGGRVLVYIYTILRGGVEFVTFITIFICGGLVGMYVYLKTTPCIGNDGIVCCVKRWLHGYIHA